MSALARFEDLQGSETVWPWPLKPDLSSDAADALDAAPAVRTAWIAFAPGDAFHHPDFLSIVEGRVSLRPDVDIFYADDVALGEPDLALALRLKPAPNPSLLLAQDYVGAPVVIRASALHQLGGLKATAGTAALYDLLLRALGLGLNLERICEVLIAHPGQRPAPTAADRRSALARWNEATGARFELAPGRARGTMRIARRFEDHPEVTVVIPTCQTARQPSGDKGSTRPSEPHVVALLDSLAATAWPMRRLNVLIGDDVEDDRIYQGRPWPFTLQRIPTPRPACEPFNYAAKMNRLWRMARTEHLVLMNDDLLVVTPGWLEALMTFAMDEDVGGVGARLIYPDALIQHAGVAGGPFGTFAHVWSGRSAGAPTYQDWALTHRDWSAVTGAVFATRRSVLELLNGFDEQFSLEYNDIDLALRMRLLGLRIVYAPDAEFTHHEKSSRGSDMPAGSQTARFLRRWKPMIADDPMYHPQLARDSFAVQPAYAGPHWYEGAFTP